MRGLLDLIRPPRGLECLDACVETLARGRFAVKEPEVLADYWAQGEEIRLHEDCRFVRSRWGGFYLAGQRLANQAMARALLQGWDGQDLEGRLLQLDALEGGYHVLDPADPRFHQVAISGRWVLVDLPLPLEDDAPTGVPNAEVFTITAAAGRFAAGEAADRRGYVRLSHSARPDCFIVQALGRSMEPGIPHGSYLLVEPSPASDGIVLAYHPDFVDDLGSCVVKRWVNGKLDSDHPDFRGRDLLPPGGSWEDVRVIGRVVRVLEPLDFVGLRAPTQPTGPVAQESAEEREQCLSELAQRREQWLRPSDTQVGTTEASKPLTESQLALSADGLQLRLLTPPLPSEGDWVQLAGQRTPASNLKRARSWKICPQPTPYLLEGPQHEPIILAPGLAGEKATLFRCPLEGVGRQLQSHVVKAGETYRCLVPPHLGHSTPHQPAWATTLGQISGWDIFELEPPDELAANEADWLNHLGLQWQAQALQLSLESAPRSYRVLDSGLQIAELDPGDPVILQVVSRVPGPVVLLAVSERGTLQQEFTQPSSEDGSLRLDLLECDPGLCIFQARCAGQSSAPLAVWLGACRAPHQLPTALSIQWEEQELADGAALDLIEHWAQLQWRLPPLWEVRLDSGGSITQQLRLRADDHGDLDLSATLAPLERQWVQNGLGTLQVTCRGLEERRLFHSRTPGEAELADKLRQLAGNLDDLDLLELWESCDLWERWLGPVLETLGYRPIGNPEAGAPIQLSCRCLRGDPLEVRDQVVALFCPVAGDSQQHFERQIPGLRLQLKRLGLAFGFLSNGRHWVYITTSGRHFPRQYDLLDCLDSEGLVEFCQQFGGEA